MAVINKNVVAVFGHGILGRATSAVNFDSQNIPSELYDGFRAVCGLARPVGTTQRRYPWRIKQPGTPSQVDVWDKFLYCTRCFEAQSPAMREWWYEQSIPSGLFYYTYFMSQTLPLVHQDIIPDWCLEVCYNANELPDEAIPPWSIFGNASNCSVSEGILTLRNVPLNPCCWNRFDIVPPLDTLDGSISISARVKGINMPWSKGYHQLMLVDGNVSGGILLLWNDKIYFNGTHIDMVTTDAFHIYEMLFRKDEVDLLVDGNKIMTRPLQIIFVSNRINFGIRNINSPSSVALWDYVCWRLDEV